MKKALLFMSFVFLSACAAKPYVPPTSGVVTDLVIPPLKTTYSVFGGVSRTVVLVGVKQEDGCSKLSNPGVSKVDELLIKIPTEKEMFVSTFFGVGNSSCTIVSSFEVEEGITYKVVPKYYGSFCSMNIEREKDGVKLEKAKLTKAYLDSWSGQKACTNKDDV